MSGDIRSFMHFMSHTKLNHALVQCASLGAESHALSPAAKLPDKNVRGAGEIRSTRQKTRLRP